MDKDENRQRTLLLVDDEANILSSLRRLFRRRGYRILTAGSGAEGLEVLAQHPVGVIVCDQRMPEMTGSEFFYKVKALYPDTLRIILSGYTDLESVTEAINVGAVFKFFTKPWDDEVLCDNVAEAFRIHELREDNQRLTLDLQEANRALRGHMEPACPPDLQGEDDVARKTLETLPWGLVALGQGRIRLINTRARQWLGSECEQGQPAAVLGQELAGLGREGCHGQSIECDQGGQRLRVSCWREALNDENCVLTLEPQ